MSTIGLPAIVLAAGLSSRMGAFKPLLPLGGRPVIGRVLDCLRASGCIDPILVVTGHHAAELAAALPGDVESVHNPDFAEGEMLSSLRAGMNQLAGRGQAGFLLAFADQPAVLPTTVAHLVRAQREFNPPLTLPTYLQKRGHPLIISARLMEEIRALPAEETLRTVVQRHLEAALQLPVNDPAIHEDLDTPADFARAELRLKEPGAGGSGGGPGIPRANR